MGIKPEVKETPGVAIILTQSGMSEQGTEDGRESAEGNQAPGAYFRGRNYA